MPLGTGKEPGMKRKLRKTRNTIAFFQTFWLLSTAFGIHSCMHDNPQDIALLYSTMCDEMQNCAVWDKGLAAIEAFLEKKGYSSVRVTGAQLRGSYDLQRHKALWIPGGSAYLQWYELTSNGQTQVGLMKIRDFVGNQAKTYIGTGAGAAMAASLVEYQDEEPRRYGLDLFDGTAKGPQLSPGKDDLIAMEQVQLTSWPESSENLPWSIAGLLNHSPYFETNQVYHYGNNKDFKLVGYWNDMHDAMVYFELDGDGPAKRSGKVLLMGPHLEVLDPEGNFEDGPQWSVLKIFIDKVISE